MKDPFPAACAVWPTDRTWRRYILHQSPPEEREQIECRLLVHAGTIDDLAAAEDALMEEALDGQLRHHDRAELVRVFACTRERRVQWTVAEGLRLQARGHRRHHRWLPGSRRRPVWLAAAALAAGIVAAATAGVVLGMITPGAPSPLTRGIHEPDAGPVPSAPSDDNPATSAERPTAMGGSSGRPLSSPSVVGHGQVSLTLLPGLRRGGDGGDGVPLLEAGAASRVRLKLVLEDPEAGSYQASIERLGRPPQPMRTYQIVADTSELSLDIDAARLEPGDYLVRLALLHGSVSDSHHQSQTRSDDDAYTYLFRLPSPR